MRVIFAIRTLLNVFTDGHYEHRKTVYYISTMMAFLKNARNVGDKDALQQRLSGVPPIVLDGLITRFTEKERDTNK